MLKAPCLATHVGCGSAVDMPTADVHILNDDLFGVGSCGLIAKQSVGTPGGKKQVIPFLVGCYFSIFLESYYSKL